MTVSYADGVFEELVSLSFYIAEADEEAAQRFLDACDHTFRFLADNRFAGASRQFRNAKLSEVRIHTSGVTRRELTDALKDARRDESSEPFIMALPVRSEPR